MPYTTDGTGHRNTDTSFAAAMSIGAASTVYRVKVLKALREVGPMTGDELAEHLDVSILTIRPRLTELSRSGLVEDSGDRRANGNGRETIVWAARVAASQ